MTTRTTALVTGGNKGLGLETARQLAQAGLHVVIGARDERRGLDAARSLTDDGLDVRAVVLDVRDEGSAAAAAASIEQQEGALDVLVNNAGIASMQDRAPGTTPIAVVREVLETNFVGALAVTQAMLPLLLRSEAPRIVNLSSALGSLAMNGDPTSPFYAARSIGYNASKAAVDMLTVQLDAEYRERGLTAVAVSPGFVKTDLLGGLGVISAAEGAAVVVRAALGPSGDLAGRFIGASGPLPW